MKTSSRPSPAAALAAAALLIAALPRPAPAGENTGLEVRLGRTVEITRSHSWCWFPTVHKFRSGEILVSAVLSPDQINSESATSAYCISTDGGLTWSRRYTMGQGANQDGAWSDVPDKDDMFWQVGSYPEPFREGDQHKFRMTLTKFGWGGRFSCEDRDATLTLTDPVLERPAWLFQYRFDGKSPVPDTRFTQQFHGRPWGNIIRDRNGDYLCTAYFTTAADSVREEAAERASKEPRYALRFNRIVLLRSTDGLNWVEQGVIAAIPPGDRPSWSGFEGFNEGSVALLPDGRLYAVYRSGGSGSRAGLSGMIGNGWSSDGGRTWTAPASIGFNGVAPRIHRMGNGMLILVTGRPGPVVLRFNRDGKGEKWSDAVTIYSEMSTRYTDVTEIAPGRLLVVYDHVPYGWFEIPPADRDARNIIYGTFVDLAVK